MKRKNVSHVVTMTDEHELSQKIVPSPSKKKKDKNIQTDVFQTLGEKEAQNTFRAALSEACSL